MPADDIVLVHLSDIHFKHARSGTPYDLDQTVRQALERDLHEIISRTGPARGIVITGDIAFAGKPEEYGIAKVWLADLTRTIGCQPDDVWATPGNHDIDRDVLRQSVVTQTLYRDLRACNPSALDERIAEIFLDAQAMHALSAPLRTYIDDFAQVFSCGISSACPNWHDDVNLSDGSILRIVGLNSVWVSDNNDNDTNCKLLLGNFQMKFPAQEGVEYITLCHHPLAWLRDADNVGPQLSRCVRLHLFGHKHRARIQRITERGCDSLCIAAGALHPERHGEEWRPTYNVLTLRITNTGLSRALAVTVYARAWSNADGRFVPDNGPGQVSETHMLGMAPRAVPTAPVDFGAEQAIMVAAAERPAADMDAMDTMPRDGARAAPIRRLTYLLLSLPYHVRIGVAQDLGLLEDDDRGIPDAELMTRFLRRAQERVLLREMWDAVSKRLPGRQAAGNPFEDNSL